MLAAGGEFSPDDTFADFMTDPLEVYNGAYTIPMGSYEITGGANPFGPVIEFTTPYVFDPKSQGIMFYVSHTGYGSVGEIVRFFAVGSSEQGEQAALSSSAGANQQQGNSLSDPFIVRFITAPVPEPGSSLMLILGAAGLLRRRR